MKIKYIKEKFFYIASIGISILFLFFVVSCVWIGHEVKSICSNTMKEYTVKTNCTEALILLLDDNKRGFWARNSAIWALGQLGDKRALPVLQKYYTGKIPQREPLDRTISQYELKKAINLAGGALNITAVFWRY